MDKRVVFAVAGSGKTTRLINELDSNKRVLLLTYTENNCAEIRRRVIRRFGHVPDNVTVSTYFTFLNSFCYRPLLLVDFKTKGISFERPDAYSSRQNISARARYVTAGGHIYHSRMARALDAMGCMPAVLRRLERYYDMVCVDEVQDFGGHDFNLLLQISRANVQTLFVGDFFQHTYSTSTDGNVKQGLHDSYERFQRELRSVGLIIDTQALQRSHRCSATVCEFIRDHIGVEIHPAQDRQSQVQVVEDAQQAAEIFRQEAMVKLFYQEHYAYPCYGQTWGSSKGQDHYQDVCVVLNPTTWKNFQDGTLGTKLAAISRNKLYVACSRAGGDLYLMPETLLKDYKAKAPRAGSTLKAPTAAKAVKTRGAKAA